MQNHLPPRFRPEAVERYRSVISSIAESWPTPIIVDPAPLAKETFRSRLRDAVKAVYLKNIAPDLFPKVNEFYHDYRIEEHNSTMLIIGPSETLKSRNRLTNVANAGSVLDGSLTLSPDAEELSPSAKVILAIATLLDANFIMAATVNASEHFIHSHLPTGHTYTILEKNGKTTIF